MQPATIPSELQQQKELTSRIVLQRRRVVAFLTCVGALGNTPFAYDALHIAANMHDVYENDSTSTSQYMQDYFAMLFSARRSAGFFVEFGGCDGLHLSNSLMLEKRFGWKGILSEPAKVWHEALHKNRSATIDTRCVWRATGEKVTFREVVQAGQSSIDAFCNSTEQETGVYEVETVSLADMLDQHNAPKYMDYLSMDTESTELEILKGFRFDAYRFGFISVEHHAKPIEDAIKALLESNGYVQVLREVSGWDGFYASRESLLVKALAERQAKK